MDARLDAVAAVGRYPHADPIVVRRTERPNPACDRWRPMPPRRPTMLRRALIMAAPRCCTVGMNSLLSQSTLTKSAAGCPATVAW